MVGVCSQTVAVLTKRGWLDKDLPVRASRRQTYIHTTTVTR